MASDVQSLQKVAIVEDDPDLRLALRSLLRSSGLAVQDFGSAEAYLDSAEHDADCLIVDVSMPGRSGPELVRVLRLAGRDVPAIFISGLEPPRELAGAPQRGSTPFFRKPFGDELLVAAVRAACAESDSGRAPMSSEQEFSMMSSPLRVVEEPAVELHYQAGRTAGFASIVGSDAGLAATVQRAQLLTKKSAPLLLQGETGVGKELFGRAVHDALDQQTAQQTPFVVLNCGGLPHELLARELFGYVEGAFVGARVGGMTGKLEAAHGGTLFLDEISELPSELQPYLLRVLESGEFYPLGSAEPRKAQFRLIAASSRDLRADMRADRFRSDLFFRISVTTLKIPPLRERRDDIADLISHFAAQAVAQHELGPKTFQPEVMSALERYAWPGNVRELRSVVETLCLLTEGSTIELATVPAELMQRASVSPTAVGPSAGGDGPELPRGLQRIERAAIEDTLRVYAGNLTRVAQELQIARSTLYLKLKKYELEHVLTELRFSSR